MAEIGVTIFIELNSAPDDYRKKIDAYEIKFDRWEPQPIADQVKLHNCTNVPKELPLWLRKA